MKSNNIITIEIKNIIIKDKFYCIDEDDPRYDINDKIKYLNKKYVQVYNNIKINNLNYELIDCLDEIGQEYCNNLLDITLDDIIICCDVSIIYNKLETHYHISYDYNFDLLKTIKII